MIDFRIQPPGYEPGIYDMPFEQYRSIPALNSSKLKKLSKSPLHFKTAIETPEEPPSAIMQKTFDKGKAFDAYILDGGKEYLQSLVAIEPELHRGSREYKKWRSTVGPGKLVLTSYEYLNIIRMAEAAYKKSKFSSIFSYGNPHRVIIWQDSETELWCKAEIDWICNDGTVVDLKTTAGADFWFFSRNARKLSYPNQGAFYLKGLEAITGAKHTEFLLAAVEVDPPFESQVFRVPPDMLYQAMDENKDRMSTLRECLETGNFYGYPDMIMDLGNGQLYDEIEEDQETGFDGF